MIREDRILDNSHILLWGIHLRSRRYAETDGCSIPDTVSTALSLTHGCFRGMEYKQCLVLADGTSYMSAHTWNDKNSLGIGTLKGHLRDKYSGSGFILPFDFHSTNQSISTSCTNTSSSNTVSYEELETYLNPYIVDYADSSTYGKSDLEMISTSLYTYNPSMNLFGRAFFTMEVGYGGEISVFTYVQSARIFPDYNTSELVGVVFAVISLIGGVVGTFAILRALMEAQSDPKGVVKKMGGAGKIFEAFLDIFIFLYVVATMTIYLYLFFDTSMSDKIRESLSGSISSYPIEFGEVLDWHEIIQILLVISNVLVFFRVLSFSALLDAVHEIIKAILKALSSMTTFFALVVVLVMITSYAGMYVTCSSFSISLSKSISSNSPTHPPTYPQKNSHLNPSPGTFLEDTAWTSRDIKTHSRHSGKQWEEMQVSCRLYENFLYSLQFLSSCVFLCLTWYVGFDLQRNCTLSLSLFNSLI